MGRDSRQGHRHLGIQRNPDADRIVRGDDELDRRRATSSAAPNSSAGSNAALWESSTFREAVVRAGWSMRLHALLGQEVAQAVDEDILTVAEAEVLLARVAVVIDQAVEAREN